MLPTPHPIQLGTVAPVLCPSVGLRGEVCTQRAGVRENPAGAGAGFRGWGGRRCMSVLSEPGPSREWCGPRRDEGSVLGTGNSVGKRLKVRSLVLWCSLGNMARRQERQLGLIPEVGILLSMQG